MRSKLLSDFIKDVTMQIFEAYRDDDGTEARNCFDSNKLDRIIEVPSGLGLTDGQGFELTYHGELIGHLFYSREKDRNFFAISLEQSIETVFERGDGRNYVRGIIERPEPLFVRKFQDVQSTTKSVHYEGESRQGPALPRSNPSQANTPSQSTIEQLRARGQIR